MGGWRTIRTGGAILTALLLGVPVPAAVGQSPSPGGPPCEAEAEPNDQPDVAPSRLGELCQTGTLIEGSDQDLIWWEVLPDDGLTDWQVTVRGVPNTATGIHFIGVYSPPGVLPLETAEVGRVDSDFHEGTPPVTGSLQLAPGRYILGISRSGAPLAPLTDDLAYRVEIRRGGQLPPSGDVEPNDDTATATTNAGAFDLSGDLAGSEDRYRWTLSVEEAARTWRIEARTSIGAPLTLSLSTVDGRHLASARADAAGRVAIHDVGVPAGDYLISVSPAASRVQPYVLSATEVTEAFADREPNDLPEQALAMDPATLAATGRLTGAPDVDHYAFDLDAADAANLVDVSLDWAGGMARSLCLSTEAGSQVACVEGEAGLDFSGLMLPAGRYLLAVTGWADLADPYELRVSRGAALPPPGDVEPNDDPSSANPVDGAFALSGHLAGSAPGTGDHFAWTISAEDSIETWRLELSATPGLGSGFQVFAPDGSSLASASAGREGTARIPDLRLAPGTYDISVWQLGSESPAYVLRSRPETATDADPEPNDTAASALPLDPTTLAARGRLTSDLDLDTYAFSVDEDMAAGLIDITLAWSDGQLRQVCVGTSFGSPIQCATGRDDAVLRDLSLVADAYILQVSGRGNLDDRYEVRVSRGLPRTPDHEVEPNDGPESATPWDETLTMHGRARTDEVDTYRITVEGRPQLWRLDVTGTGLRAPEWWQPDATHVGSPSLAPDRTAATVEDLFLVAGDHLLAVGAEGDYSMTLTPLGEIDPAAEREPNDDVDHAGRLPLRTLRTGRLPAPEDVDTYRFTLAAPEHVVITVQPPPDGSIDLEVTSAETTLGSATAWAPGQPTAFEGSLPQGDYTVWLRPAAVSAGEYSVELERADPFVSPSAPAQALPATLVLEPEVSEVAAYIADGQRIDAMLTITSTAGADLALSLDATTSDSHWRVELPEEGITLPAGGIIEVPLVIHAGADATRGVPVRVTLRARDTSGAQRTGFTEITPSGDVAPVSPVQAWTVPFELLGGLDVASPTLGATNPGNHFHEWDLHDGLSIAGLGVSGSIQNAPDTLEVDLAGEELVPVAGIVLDPLTGDPFAWRPRAFELLLSTDGEAWEPALDGELGSQTVRQYFVLPEPVPARFARLRIDTTWAETPGSYSLGEWKVIAEPGFSPTAGPLNIGDPGAGGHFVWTNQQWISQYVPEALDAALDPMRSMWLEPGQSLEWVVGFWEDRAAHVTGFEWVDLSGSDPAARFDRVTVEASVDSPMGPWQSLGTWSLERAADGTVKPFTLPEPAWARFLRFSGGVSATEGAYRELPGTLRILERPTDGTYRSILGEWGHSSPAGIYELLVPPVRPTDPGDEPDAGDSPAEATPLAAGETVEARVARSLDEDWYLLTIPEGQNTLNLELRTERASDIRFHLQDEAGRRVLLERDGPRVATTEHWQAVVEPGRTYRLGLEQPIMSVYVSFDTSASIDPWLPALRAAVRAFADDVTPGFEAVRIVPFEEEPLFEGWSDQPYIIGGGIDAWTHPSGSSSMASSLLNALDDLEKRDGTRAILLLGDAVGGGFATLGGIPADRLEAVGARLYAVHLGGIDDPFVSTDIMHDLVAAGDGTYQYAVTQGDMDRAFDRMATQLRRPAAYAVSYGTSNVEHLPATLQVLPAEGTSVPIGGGAAVELILDTSGSMLVLLDGWTRISWAQETLVKLVNQALPVGLPVALRTFKAKKKSCDTVLTVPLGPLDREAMVGVINGLKVNKGTRTPLGGALANVLGDMEGVTGPRVVVLVTDGQETCKGDPEGEVRTLIDAGVEATINIVGFALDDPKVKADMASWAELGGGSFFDAQDSESLLAGVTAALQAPFRVYDQAGAQVASGIVGGQPVELPAGIYRVEVLTDPRLAFEEVEVGPGDAKALQVEGRG